MSYIWGADASIPEYIKINVINTTKLLVLETSGNNAENEKAICISLPVKIYVAEKQIKHATGNKIHPIKTNIAILDKIFVPFRLINVTVQKRHNAIIVFSVIFVYISGILNDTDKDVIIEYNIFTKAILI